MPNPPAWFRRHLLLSVLCLASGAVSATRLAAVQVRGLDEEMAANVRAALSIEQLDAARRADLSEGRLSFYLRNAPREVREALEPFGYYDAEVTPEIVRDGDAVTVIFAVVLGEPVRVRALDVGIDGAGAQDPVLAALVGDFRPARGAVFHHGQYESSKAAISRALNDRGYFDADLSAHRVEVTRAAHAADIGLHWTGGLRYALGAASFEGHPFEPGLLEKLVPWKPGEPYDQAQLLRLQESLTDLDYFNAVSLTPEPDQAKDEQVPIKVVLVPAKRSIYSAGVRYGTDSGAGISGRVERRWMNRRGHKALLDVNLAQYKSDVTAQYRIPAFAWLDGWYAIGARASEEDIEDITSQYAELSATRSGRWRQWSLLAGLYLKRERFDTVSGNRIGDYGYTNLVYPGLWAQWQDSDNRVYPQRGLGLTLDLRAGTSALGSDVDFLQLRAEGRYIRALGNSNRVLLRAELGTTISDEFAALPPSERFYAGGDKSVRGYGYKEIGERSGQFYLSRDGRHVIDPVFGGRHLAVASAEIEHMFTPVWGGALFVDAGDAWDERFEVEVGVGAGLRWRSPVGPVRVDLAHGLGDAQQTLRLHIVIGPDL